MNIYEYIKYLRTKHETAQRINENSLMQQQAVKSNNTALLGKLLKRQQGNIDKLQRIYRQVSVPLGFEKDTELKQLETDIKGILYDAIQTSITNISGAEVLKDTIGNSICRLKINGNAIKNGYFKKSQQQHGYFIDKKK